jgi:hypothetical protein
MIGRKTGFRLSGARLEPVADQSLPAPFVKGLAGIAAIAAVVVAF